MPVNEAGYKEIAAVLVLIGSVGTLWFGYIGYGVLRGAIAVGALPMYFLTALVVMAASQSART
jgi:hypothetical protein